MDELKELVSRLERVYYDRLVSAILYGSAASGEHHGTFSELNVLCVLTEITPRELSEGEPILRWWREHGHPSPWLLSEEEVHRSADSFPIEYRDMKDRRKVLYGPDVIADVRVDPRYYRAQVEREMRSNLLRLRQQAAGILSDPQALLNLCLDSVPAFCTLGRHALVLADGDARTERRAVLHQLQEKLKADMGPLGVLLDVREDRAGTDPGDPGELFAKYLMSIQALVLFVDRSKRSERMIRDYEAWTDHRRRGCGLGPVCRGRVDGYA